MCDDVIMLRAGVRRRPGLAAGAHRALRPREHGGGVPRHRARTHRRARPRRHGRGRRSERSGRGLAVPHRRRGVAAARARDIAPPRLSDPALVDAHRVDDVLPDGDDGDLGVPHALSRADQQFPARRARILHRRRAAVGPAVSRPARRLADVHRGVLRAQPRQPVRLAAHAARVHRGAAHDQPLPRADRRRRRVPVRVSRLSATRSSRSGFRSPRSSRISSSSAGGSASRCRG